MITQNKNKFKYMTFSYDVFNKKSFLNFIMTNFYLNRTYTFLFSLGVIAICYNLFLLNISENKLESLLLKILTVKIVQLFLKSLIFF